MFAFIWSCVVIAIKGSLGVTFIGIGIILVCLVVAAIISSIEAIIGKNKTDNKKQKEEDFNEWWKEQNKDRDKWGNA